MPPNYFIATNKPISINDRLVSIDPGQLLSLIRNSEIFIANYFNSDQLIFTGKTKDRKCLIFYFSTSRLFPSLYHRLILIITVCQEEIGINQFKKGVCHELF